MDSLFDDLQSRAFEPLAVRMRPTSLDDFYGQDKAVGKGSFLRAMLEDPLDLGDDCIWISPRPDGFFLG